MIDINSLSYGIMWISFVSCLVIGAYVAIPHDLKQIRDMIK